MGRIAFVPWAHAQAPEFEADVIQWNSSNTHHGHTWSTVHFGDGREVIKSLSVGSTIRIMGHGAPGDHTIDADVHGGGSLKYDEVCDRLIATGLTRSFAGTIDCNSCSSATATLGRQSFAAKVSQYLRGKGYLLISVVGYFGALDARYNNFMGGKYQHMNVTLFGWEAKKKWARVRF